MKVLVTGSKGFVGKAVVEELLLKKYFVREFDTKHGHNILDKHSLLTEMKGIDAVIHLAAIIENENQNLWKINVEGTRNVVEAALKKGVKKIIFLSTTGVYGFTKGTTNENSELRPENNYEKSKIEGEKIVREAEDIMETNIIRSAMVFGPNEYWKKMIHMLKKKYPLPCGGENHYQIIFVEELARAIEFVLRKGKSGETYLISGKEKPTLNEFCEMIQEEIGIEKGLKHTHPIVGILAGKISGAKLLTADNIRHISKERNYNIRKIERLGWKQKDTLREAIHETVEELGEGKNKHVEEILG